MADVALPPAPPVRPERFVRLDALGAVGDAARPLGPIERLANANPSIQDAMTQMDSSAAVTVEPMTSAVAFAFLPSRIGAVLVGLLGALGAGLAMVGLYGVVAFVVSRRTPEIGIRMALGATDGRVLRLVLADSGMLVVAGLVIGLGGALIVTTPLAAFLVAELPSRDPVSFTASAILLLATSALASWGPARRATRIAPASALRAE